MNRTPSPSDRLLFIPVTVESCRAGLVSNDALASVIGADVPSAWPPQSLDTDTITEFMALLNEPGRRGLYSFYWLKRPGKRDELPVLLGSGGFIIHPDGIYELGYSVVPPFLKQGYATEAVRALITWIFLEKPLAAVIARTFPDNPGSIRVLEKNGFYLLESEGHNHLVTYRITRNDLSLE
jgi:ribosomal-protein-alanine N-acetyltransferase